MPKSLTATFRKFDILIVCVLSVALGFSLAINLNHARTYPVVAAPAKSEAMGDWRSMFADIAEKLEPTVVNITSEKTVTGAAMPDIEDFFSFGPFDVPRIRPRTESRPVRAAGSGVIVRSDGYILTNDHVVGGADRVDVKLADGREFKGTVLRDPRTDLALVKIDARDLPAAQLADSDKVRVGEWALAIGNPFGFNNTLTVGVVSAVQREFSVPDPDNPLGGTYYPDAIQTDAAINMGNSGGPLVNLEGKVIGINSAIYSRTGGNVGIGFAIPSDTARFVMEQLITKGKVVRGYLGLIPEDLTPVLADKLGVKQGALVESVDKGSPADNAGIQVKDVITKIDNKPVTSAISLRRIVQAIAPGTTVKVVVVRDKKEKTLSVKLGEAPGVEGESTQVGTDKIGLSVQPMSPEIAKEIGVDADVRGVVVRRVAPGTAAERAGIQAKDVIIEIDNAAITSVATFNAAIKKLKKGDTAIVVVQRGKGTRILEMTID